LCPRPDQVTSSAAFTDCRPRGDAVGRRSRAASDISPSTHRLLLTVLVFAASVKGHDAV
jgi:hypothetical protein